MERVSRLESIGGLIAAGSMVVFATMAADTAMAAGIATSKHNLSLNTNSVYQTTTTEICVFCHTPHGGDTSKDAPLWNRGATATGTGFTLYDGSWGSRPSTFDGSGEALQPPGSISALCLSCHDGATALDLLINKPGSGGFNSGGLSAGFTFNGTDNKMPSGGITNIGSDLRNDHPIGVPYCGGKASGASTAGPTVVANCKDSDFNAAATDSGLFWVDNSVGTTGTREKTDMILYVRAFTNSGNWPSVECGSCHDPHSSNATFLRIPNTGSQLCLTCHAK